MNNFIKHYLCLKKTKEKNYIFCTIRKKFVLFKKEEITRQYIIFLLKTVKNYKNSNIFVETSIRIQKIIKRLDILVLDKKKILTYLLNVNHNLLI